MNGKYHIGEFQTIKPLDVELRPRLPLPYRSPIAYPPRFLLQNYFYTSKRGIPQCLKHPKSNKVHIHAAILSLHIFFRQKVYCEVKKGSQRGQHKVEHGKGITNYIWFHLPHQFDQASVPEQLESLQEHELSQPIFSLLPYTLLCLKLSLKCDTRPEDQ